MEYFTDAECTVPAALESQEFGYHNCFESFDNKYMVMTCNNNSISQSIFTKSWYCQQAVEQANYPWSPEDTVFDNTLRIDNPPEPLEDQEVADEDDEGNEGDEVEEDELTDEEQK